MHILACSVKIIYFLRKVSRSLRALKKAHEITESDNKHYKEDKIGNKNNSYCQMALFIDVCADGIQGSAIANRKLQR